MQDKIHLQNKDYTYYSLSKLASHLGVDFTKVPKSIKILIENILRNSNGDYQGVISLIKREKETIHFYPTRVLMQDFTGVPALVDLASMRDAGNKLGIDPKSINPLLPVDLVIDHSVQVDDFGDKESFARNVSLEMKRNGERYQFLKWGQAAFDNLRVVPPGMGICHQVNLEYLAKVVWMKEVDGEVSLYPDTLVGTDSHTTMVNALSVLGWGVGGIEAESVMLGQPIALSVPDVFGVRLVGELREGVTATDLVLHITSTLRKIGVVGKFVEFYGSGLDNLSLSERATIANMAPEYGATCGFFPVDDHTLDYLRLTGRENVQLVEEYARVQGLWNSEEPEFRSQIDIDLSTIETALSGPKRPQDKTNISALSQSFFNSFPNVNSVQASISSNKLNDASVVIAAITSCTNTSNPSVMIAAGLLARNAISRGLKTKDWVKTSLAPGSKVVVDYLKKSGLDVALNELGFNVVGYGCTTCIGNSGPLRADVSSAIKGKNLVVASILSGNRNFEGRIHPEVKANYLASPPLVVAYALAGTVNIDLYTQPIGQDREGNDVLLKDIWPSNDEVKAIVRSVIQPEMFKKAYQVIFDGDKEWQKLQSTSDELYSWDDKSSYIQNPPYFNDLTKGKAECNIYGARILAVLGDSVTTDHISPAGNISIATPAGKYLQSLGVEVENFNSYGARRGNHNIMMRGTFANIRIKNEMLKNIEGGFTKHIPTDEVMSIYDAAMLYREQKTPLVVIAGKEYGTGSSRDWAAKGTLLLGVKAVLAESFERIHRSNLIGMGVIPFVFKGAINRKTLELDGSEMIDIDLTNLAPKKEVECKITYADSVKTITIICDIDNSAEMQYFKNQGILQYVLLNKF